MTLDWFEIAFGFTRHWFDEMLRRSNSSGKGYETSHER